MSDPHNPHYDDPTVFYDAGFFYADGLPDPPKPNSTQRSKAMSSISAGLSRKNSTLLIGLADLVISKIAPATPATPPIPNMAAKAAALTAKRDAAKAANDAYESARAGLVALKATRDATADELRDEHTVVISAIEAEARGDAALLGASGYPLASAAVQSTTPPAQILNLFLTAGDASGTLDLTFDPDALAKTYEVQITTTHPIDGPWTTMVQPTTSSTKLTGLTSGQRVWLRVRGIGSNGPGAWSDPATKIVP
jgi:hypothetical protein